VPGLCLSRCISTTSSLHVFKKIFEFASFLRRRQLEGRGITVTNKGLFLDGVQIDSEIARVRFLTPARHYKLERYWAAGIFPLIPAAYFIHNPTMDLALAVAITLHTHWGIETVAKDYARPIILGKELADFLPRTVLVLSIMLFASLLHFNFADVGITKAFEMLFSL